MRKLPVENPSAPPFHCLGSRLQLFLNFSAAAWHSEHIRRIGRPLSWTRCEDINQIRPLFDAYWVYWSLPAYPCWLIVFAAQDETLILGYWNSAWNQQWQGPCFVSTEVTMTLIPNIVCKLFNAVGQSHQQAHTLHRFLLNSNACRVI